MKVRFPFILKAYFSCILLSLGTSVSKAEDKPNVLFIICDDLNYVVQGEPGRITLPTPGIDKLKRMGIQFTNAHTNVPICAPSRASLLSGLYPQTTQFYWFDNWRDNPILKTSVSFLKHFKNNGYTVYGTGKINHNGQEDYADYTQFGPKDNFGPFPSDGNPNRKHMLEHPAMSYLFDKLKLPYRWEQTFGPLSLIPEWKPDSSKGIPGYTGWTLYGKPFKYENDENRDLMPDELSAAWASDILQKKSDKPFFLALGFNRPHTPLYAPQKYFDQFPLDKIELPKYLKGDTADAAGTLANPVLYGYQRFNMLQLAGGDLLWKKWVQAYLANVAFLDDQVSKVLDALAKSPNAKNTIIILTSDHGFHMGEKAYLYKQSGWEESTRIPFIVSVPGLTKPGICTKPISLIDVYPTLADLCGLPANPNMQGNGYLLDGTSLRPLLKDPKKGTWNGPAVALTVISGKDHITAAKLPGIQPPHFSLRSENWRYILTDKGEEELYDHIKDPFEWKNLANDKAYATQKANLKNQLLKVKNTQATKKQMVQKAN